MSTKSPPSPDAWIEVVTKAPVALSDGIAAEFITHVPLAKGGAQIRRNEVVFWVQPAHAQAALEEVRACLQSLQTQGWQLEKAEVQLGVEEEETKWRDAWKRYFHTIRLTRQIVVVPSWESYKPEKTDLCIHLDPGQAFGTGAHASTQLVLSAMQDLFDSGKLVPKTILDVGTGSGILAIAAAKFWPEAVIEATDIDPQSVSSTKENAKGNGVEKRIEVSLKSLTDLERKFPLVLANIQAHILRSMRDELLSTLMPGGTLMLSGILSTQIEPLVQFFGQAGARALKIRESELNPEWSSAVLTVD